MKHKNTPEWADEGIQGPAIDLSHKPRPFKLPLLVRQAFVIGCYGIMFKFIIYNSELK